jgi:hypothetical protein
VTEPLTQIEQEAAEWLAEGVSKTEVGARLGQTRSKVKVLEGRADFRALVEQHRPDLPATAAPVRTGTETDSDERILSRADRRRILEQIALRTDNKGLPTGQAEKAILNLNDLEKEEEDERLSAPVVYEREIVTLDAELDDQVQQIIAEANEGETVFVVLAAKDCGRGAPCCFHMLQGGVWGPLQADPAAPWGNTPPTDEPTRDAG